jgi:TorA maturation chaperone TorD
LAAVSVADDNNMMRETGTGKSRKRVVDELDYARAREYTLLATLLVRGPDTQLLRRLAILQGDATPLGMAHAALADASRVCSEKSVAREYLDLFAGLGQGQIFPYASHYLTGSLYGRPLVKLRETFQQLGIERVSQSEPEDHMATLCEIMASLIGGTITGPDGCDRDLFADHLGTWAPRFFLDLERGDPAGFYGRVGLLGRVFVEIEAEAYSFPA